MSNDASDHSIFDYCVKVVFTLDIFYYFHDMLHLVSVHSVHNTVLHCLCKFYSHYYPMIVFIQDVLVPYVCFYSGCVTA